MAGFLTRSILVEVFQLYLHKFPISHYFHPVGLRSFHRSFSEFNFPDLRRRKLSVKVCTPTGSVKKIIFKSFRQFIVLSNGAGTIKISKNVPFVAHQYGRWNMYGFPCNLIHVREAFNMKNKSLNHIH